MAPYGLNRREIASRELNWGYANAAREATAVAYDELSSPRRWGSSTPRLRDSIINALEYINHPLSRMMTVLNAATPALTHSAHRNPRPHRAHRRWKRARRTARNATP